MMTKMMIRRLQQERSLFSGSKKSDDEDTAANTCTMSRPKPLHSRGQGCSYEADSERS